MADRITDKQVVTVLRPFVRATTPMLDALRDANPLGAARRALPTHATPVDHEDAQELAKVKRGLRRRLLRGLESVQFPGTTAWETMTVDQRDRWWVNRVGRVTVLLASIPGLGGALADRLPIQNALATAGQALMLTAIAAEHGVTDQAERVRLIAKVLFNRDIDPHLAAGHGDHLTPAQETEAAKKLTEDLDESTKRHGKVTVKATARALRRLAQTLWSLGDELDKRPQGRFYHRALGYLPIIGMAADYLGERSALKRAAKKGRKWLAAHPPT
ncbi:hypothetical protein [Actinokineospora iranica]|uniref:Uncharacterized protein n=1 Tax=Actinokineospora iranica TaxID=1271860 RepID=A0A1G6R7J0_9PSEU|nr:hypothetical protein [Actinokineospora iranica]SDD00599.1 hypothetical protein SAMN05216174_106196 [Actinokineospora iranica]